MAPLSFTFSLRFFSCNRICQWHHLEPKCERRRAARRRWAGESGVLKGRWGLNLQSSWVGPPASQSPSVYSVEGAALTPPSLQQLNSPLLPCPHISIITSFVFSCPSLHPHFFKTLLSSLLVSSIMNAFSFFSFRDSFRSITVSLSDVNLTLKCFTYLANIWPTNWTLNSHFRTITLKIINDLHWTFILFFSVVKSVKICDLWMKRKATF